MGKKISETGHAINYGRMATTITIVERVPNFNPIHDSIKTDALREYLGVCGGAMEGVKTAEDAYDRAVNRRRELYDSVRKLATRAVNAYIDAGAAAADVDDVRAVNRKLQGQTTGAAKDPGQDEEGKRHYSTSQQSFISLADQFDSIVTRISAFPGYTPAEEDLKPAALKAFNKSLTDANDAVDLSASALRDARRDRNKLFYDEERGMVARGKRLRNYFKSRKDGANPLKGISFRNLG